MTITSRVKRTGHLLGAVAFTFATVLSVVALAPGKTSAYGLTAQRYVQMSNTAEGDLPGGTAVSYEIGFKIGTSGPVEGIVIDFCSNSPLIGTACTAPTGLTPSGTPSVVTNGGASDLGTGWTANDENTGRTLTLTHATGPSLTAGDDAIITVSTMTNPTTAAGTFYARILTFAVDTNVATWLGTADGSAIANVIDAGGVAMSTTTSLALTAKVQETITFCVYETSCGVGSAVTLGDGNGVLSNTAVDYEDSATYNLGSNAFYGVTVRLFGDTLKSGANDIVSHGTSCTADSVTTTVEQFGLQVIEGAGQTADATYNCSGDQHAFDTTAATTLYGDIIATTAGATDASLTTLEYSAKAATTTDAGIYTATHNFIATAKY